MNALENTKLLKGFLNAFLLFHEWVSRINFTPLNLAMFSIWKLAASRWGKSIFALETSLKSIYLLSWNINDLYMESKVLCNQVEKGNKNSPISSSLKSHQFQTKNLPSLSTISM